MIKKLVIGLAVVAMVFGASASMTNALTAADVTTLCAVLSCTPAQTTALMALVTPSTGGSMMSYTFNTNLTVGSKGADVNALQQILIDGGYLNIAAPTGYFGNATKAAVIAWQKASGISPAAGYVGSISRAALNSMKPATTPTTPTTPGTPTTPTGTTGVLTSFALALEGSPADGTDVRIGTKNIDIAKWKIKASNDVGILRQFGIKTTHRAWLYWKSARLMVDGQVVAEKTGLTSADFQEVTTGSDYRLIFGNLNNTLPIGKDVYVVLQVDAIDDSSRTAASGLVVDQASNSVVVADVNDNYTVSDGVTTDRTYDFVVASTGNIVPSLNTASPNNRWVKVTESGTTPNMTMLVFDVKAEQKDVELNTVVASASTSGQTLTTLISGWDLYEGSCPTDGSTSGCTALAGGSVSGSTVTFSSLHTMIPSGTKKTFTIKALLADEDDYTAGTDDVASTTLFASTFSFTGVDQPTFNTVTVSGSNVTGGDAHTILVAPTLSNANLVISNDQALEYLKHFSDGSQFTLTANGGSLYVSKTAATALATTTSASSTAVGSAGVGITTITSDAQTGDTSTYFVVQDGASRTFRLAGSLSNQNGTAGTKNFTVSRIYFDDDTSGLQEFYFDTTFSQMSNMNKDFYMGSVDVTQ